MIEKNPRSTITVKSHYDENAANYDRVRFGTPGGQHVNLKEQGFVLSIINASNVLEIGTATGRFAECLLRAGVEYTGIDISRNMLKSTNGRTGHAASLIQMDASRLGLRQHFDHVLCLRTFQFLQKPVEALKEMHAAMVPKGTCVVTFETDNLVRRLLVLLRVGVSQQFYYKRSEVEQMFVRAGFEIVRSGAVMRIPVTLYRRCPKTFLWLLAFSERLWPWSMHDYVLGAKSAV